MENLDVSVTTAFVLGVVVGVFAVSYIALCISYLLRPPRRDNLDSYGRDDRWDWNLVEMDKNEEDMEAKIAPRGKGDIRWV